MKRSALKRDAIEVLIKGMQCAISQMPGDVTPSDLENRDAAIEQFRRVEKLFGFKPGTHSPFA